ncbi:protein lifeguard 1 [Hoplias malabaricus]|uniref:protein lifeguard 1 n=1 Tax=Hoplias malabaricus TaxID=27720 RepID=UPI003461EB69
MTDVQKQPSPTEVEGGPSVPGNNPPPYPPEIYPPPPYPSYPPEEPSNAPIPPATCPPAYPPDAPTQESSIVFNPPPEEIAAVPGTGAEKEADTVLLVSSFNDDTVRRAFIRKVFSVVTLQLLFTFSVVCLFTFAEPVKGAVQGNLWIYLSSYIIFMIIALCLSCFSSFSRRHPWNIVALSVVTLSLSYMVGTVASYHDATAVVIAMGSTLVISVTIIIFSAQTRVDFTICNGVLTILAVDLLMFGFFSIFFYSNILQIVYGCLGALLYALFLAVDCQLVMGRQKYALNPEEYVFAALVIYLDIILIFLYILMIVGGGSKN